MWTHWVACCTKLGPLQQHQQHSIIDLLGNQRSVLVSYISLKRTCSGVQAHWPRGKTWTLTQIHLVCSVSAILCLAVSKERKKKKNQACKFRSEAKKMLCMNSRSHDFIRRGNYMGERVFTMSSSWETRRLRSSSMRSLTSLKQVL